MDQWGLLQRLADAVERGEAHVDFQVVTRHVGDMQADDVRLDVRSRGNVAELLSTRPTSQERYEAAERLSTRYAEIADDARKEAEAKGRASTGPSEADALHDCPLCDAPRGAWCQPVHDGERGGGGWYHPERRALHAVKCGERHFVETRMHPRAESIAVRVLTDAAGYAYPRAARDQLKILAESVLAVARRERMCWPDPEPGVARDIASALDRAIRYLQTTTLHLDARTLVELVSAALGENPRVAAAVTGVEDW